MKFSEAHRPSRPRSSIAIAAVVCVLAAVVGCWLLRFERGTPDTPPSAVKSLAAVHIDQAHLNHASSPASHAPFKSAGLHRDRPPTQLRMTPVSQASPSPISLPPVWCWPGGTQARTPTPDHSGQDLLTQFCVARR
ncbi:hypothetical protein [Mycobacterium kyorinense]|uniref:Lipoprotein LpqS n=1 Tax=Mycobacterium kyorinense TaxID=487514 RepID=A0A1X1YBW6_9MYCO|nr:hypothetical protein [Mycobacterium kyorinense]ORW08593.1 hypothetical protein AWC14_22895 [Mycobacterium kyorinense]